jgi:serine/threonine protein kinase/tetratricopeptide (TPR) repeat protein
MADASNQVRTPPPQHRVPEDLTGRTIGRFRIEARLGAGGMGEVYRAFDSKLQRTVAIKRMSGREGLTAADHALFLREGQRASALNHANVAGIYDVLDEGDEILLVMEFVPGSTLREHIGEPIPLERFFEIAIQCTNALAAAHQTGILHGDIKPENIMLGLDGQVKLLDFGVARRLPGSEADSATASLNTISKAGHISGTPAYMAPEVLKGETPDARSDIFALGIVFYEMLTGKHPFHGSNVTVITAHILDEREAARVHATDHKIPPRVSAIISRALKKDPARRYVSARELREDLEAVRDGGRPARVRSRYTQRWLWRLAPVAVLVVLASFLPPVRSRIAALWNTRSHAPAASTPAQAPVLAVLPPQVDGSSPELRAFADGLSATVAAKLTGLSENHEIEVVDAAHVNKATASGSAPDQALKTLGANLTLQLTVQQSGEMNRAIYKLADVKSGQVLAEQTLTAPRSDPFSIEDRVADGVVNALRIDLRPEEKTALATHGTTEPAAYDYFLQGRGYLSDDIAHPEHVADAIAVLNRALELDPKYGRAFAARGEAYWRNYGVTKQSKWIDDAKSDCNKAVSLGNAGSEGHLCLGLVAAGTGQYQQAANEYQKAIELDPTDDDGYVGLAKAYTSLNRLNDAERVYQQAITQKPNSLRAVEWLAIFYLQQAEYAKAADLFQKAIRLAPESYLDFSNLGASYVYLGNYPQAIAALEQSIKLRPTAGAYSNLGTAYYQSHRFAEAASNYEAALKFDAQNSDLWGNLADAYLYSGQRPKAVEAFKKQLQFIEEQLKVNPNDAERQGDAAGCYAMLGDRENAVAHLDRSLALGHGDKDLLFNAAVVYNDLRETGTALEWLQKAFTAGYSASVVRDSPDFDNLRNNPQFQELLAHAQVK